MKRPKEYLDKLVENAVERQMDAVRDYALVNMILIQFCSQFPSVPPSGRGWRKIRPLQTPGRL